MTWSSTTLELLAITATSVCDCRQRLYFLAVSLVCNSGNVLRLNCRLRSSLPAQSKTCDMTWYAVIIVSYHRLWMRTQCQVVDGFTSCLPASQLASALIFFFTLWNCLVTYDLFEPFSEAAWCGLGQVTQILCENQCNLLDLDRLDTLSTRSIWKMLGPFATRAVASPFSRCRYRYCRAPPAHRCARRQQQRQRVTGDRYGPMEWAQWWLKCNICIRHKDSRISQQLWI